MDPVEAGSIYLPRHTLTELDVKARTAVCEVCGPTRIRSHGLKAGKRRYRCWYVQVRSSGTRSYAVHKGDTCSWCQFQGHFSQLDTDHLDENHQNNDLDNLDTKCCRCHRLKTFFVRTGVPESEWLKLRERYGAVPNPPDIDVSGAKEN
jgi:hypothetical protein